MILDKGMGQSLVMCSLTSSGIIGENLELLNWKMDVSKSIESKGAFNCGQCVLETNTHWSMCREYV